MREIFKDIPEYEGLYQASNLGRIKSLYFNKEKILKYVIESNGYLRVALQKNNIYKKYTIHNLILLTFKGKCPKGKQRNHIDGNKQNNRLDNLEYITGSENLKHAWKLGLCNNNGKRIKIKQYDKKGNFISEFISQKEASIKTGINKGSICQCIKNNYKFAGGFIWEKA